MVHIDSIAYRSKEEAKIDLAESRVLKKRLQEDTKPELATLGFLMNEIQRGCSVSFGVMNGGKKAENWIQQQIFAVDIDNEADEILAKKLKVDINQLTEEEKTPILSIKEALKICEDNNLPVSFYYNSFSHSEEKPKYRIVFVFDEVITHESNRRAILEVLIGLFRQADKSGINADRVFFGTDKEVVACDLESRVSLETIYQLYEAPIMINTVESNTFRNNQGNVIELEELKRNFDFFGYLQQRNGGLKYNNSKNAMFHHCELCGHKNDLVYYHNTNTFKCFGSGCDKGGSIIDYLMLIKNINRTDATKKFIYDICGIEKKEYSQREKYNYVIQKRMPMDSELYQIIKNMKPEVNYKMDDKGNGELFSDVFKDKARYNITSREWYIYNGKIWVEDTGGMVVSRYAKELADVLLVYSTTIEDDSRSQKYREYIAKLGQLRYRKTMLEDSKDKFFISNNDLDKDLYLFNCQNCVIDLRTFKTRTHSPDDLLSKISNVVYNPEARSPLFEKFIGDVMQNNPKKIEYLQKLFGYSLTGDTREETCYMLYGSSTRNGKSTLVETIAYMMGGAEGYSLNMKPETLAQKQNNDSRQASGDIARLNNCRFLNASEPPKRMVFDVGLLKTLLGRDSITARHLHEREFQFVPCFKLFINTNFLPLITDDTLFSSGRINVITFDRHFNANEQDRHLKDKLKDEINISGIFNWCLSGLQKFYEYGAIPPEDVINATSEYRSNSDKIGNFIAECLEESKNNCMAKEVYEIYQNWCKDNGYGAENKSNFFAELRSKGILAQTGTVNRITKKNVIIGYQLNDWIEVSENYNVFAHR